MNSIKQCLITDHTKCKLTKTEKSTLLQWILSINKHSAFLKSIIVQDMINILLINYDTLKLSSTVEINWVNKIIQQHNILKTQFSQKYNYKKALYENSKIIQKWFKLIQQTIEKQRIA